MRVENFSVVVRAIAHTQRWPQNIIKNERKKKWKKITNI